MDSRLVRGIAGSILVSLFPVLASAGELTIAAAANAQYALGELKAEFEKETGIAINTVIGSSGKLAAQIANGAPFDLFLSADMEYPQAVYREGLAYQEPGIYAYGVLVLRARTGIDIAKGVEVIAGDEVRRIAIPNPRTAPYGREAVKAIEYYGLSRAVRDKLVYGESVSQANQFLVSGAVDVCFTAKSVLPAPGVKEEGRWAEVDPKAYRPLAQGVVILKYGQRYHLAAAKKFYDFLFSDKGREIFKSYGYLLP